MDGFYYYGEGGCSECGAHDTASCTCDKQPRHKRGKTGPRGCQGKRGEKGPQGDQGEIGYPGQPGPIGERGPQGVQGSDGADGGQGSQGPQGNQGPQGEGPQGPQGEQGVQGPPGSDMGVQGPQGDVGPQGPQGVGPQGPQGDGGQGPQGDQGPQGPQGNQGNQGPQGPQGSQGPQGTGPQGVQGPQGSSGSFGTMTMEFLTANQITPVALSTTISYSELTNYNYNLPYPTFTLDDAATGTLKFISLSNDDNAPVKIKTNRGRFILNAPEANSQLVYSLDHWIDFIGDQTWYVGNQQGPKLVGSGGSGAQQQGEAVSLSADGNTLAFSGSFDGGGRGGIWMFIRSGTVWSQQGDKLVVTGNSGAAQVGSTISISADGNTLAAGGTSDNGSNGATWIFIRSGTSWSQQGNKLVGTGNVGAAVQGFSVSLSADGSNLAVGADADNGANGATWIFIRSGTVWSQQGPKLVGAGNAGTAQQGTSVSISSSGNTVAVGGINDNSSTGATWIFIRSGTVWSQQGLKLVGTGGSGSPQQGKSVSLSSDGNTLAVGGITDNAASAISSGAVWIFVRSGTAWTQQGLKLTGSGNSGSAQFGQSVSLSGDGNTLAVGGNLDNGTNGATWIFTRYANNWTQQESKLVGTGNSGAAQQGYSVSLSAEGNTLAVGGPSDPPSQGAAWIFA